MGGDSAAVEEEGYELRVRADPKVFKVGPLVIGFAGSFRAGQLVRHELQAPAHRRGVKVDQYIGSVLVGAMRRLFIEGGVGRKENNVEDSGASFLIGYRGRIFTLEADWNVGENVHPYDATGSGAAAALGALHVTKALAPRPRVLAALGAAQAFSAGVRAPFIIIEPDRTKTKGEKQ